MRSTCISVLENIQSSYYAHHKHAKNVKFIIDKCQLQIKFRFGRLFIPIHILLYLYLN